ncbi:hypothetical protein WJX72_012071 [[Myrmecia] bisecta]|uniref:Uncharacterized protein n=1 Tax=[Myrmecia] bisecta TaxID=41462 RepID=A0AAW1PXF5_9CHLO
MPQWNCSVLYEKGCCQKFRRENADLLLDNYLEPSLIDSKDFRRLKKMPYRFQPDRGGGFTRATAYEGWNCSTLSEQRRASSSEASSAERSVPKRAVGPIYVAPLQMQKSIQEKMREEKRQPRKKEEAPVSLDALHRTAAYVKVTRPDLDALRALDEFVPPDLAAAG